MTNLPPTEAGFEVPSADAAAASAPETRSQPNSKLSAGPFGRSAPRSASLRNRYAWRADGKMLVQHLLDSEMHTFAFSVAANAILSFIPFIVLLYTLARKVFHSNAMADVIGDMIGYFVPANHDFIERNLSYVAARQDIQFFSLVMILVACTGIFLPLEVALNRSWGVTKSRNYLLNQALSFGLVLWMAFLALGSILLVAGERGLLTFLFSGHTDNIVFHTLFPILDATFLLLVSIAAYILVLFAIYWLLPNCRVPALPILRVSIVTGLVLAGAKILFVAVLPLMHLKSLYGGFYVSVGLIFWAYVAGMILFAGAQFSASRHGESQRQAQGEAMLQ